MEKFCKIISLVLLSTIVFSCFIYTVDDVKDKDTYSLSEDCIINGRKITFIDHSDKTDWIEPLAKLLANQSLPYGEHGELIGYKVTIDPDAPSIPPCYACGLFDITMDGVPELLVHPLGYFGSSGTSTYFIYDIYTGDMIGEINGGNAESWCVYYDTNADDCIIVGQYWLRYGWPERNRYLLTVEYDQEINKYCELEYLRSNHMIEAEKVSENEETEYWEEYYPDTSYYIYGKETSLDSYCEELDRFTASCVRIAETELIMIGWGSVTGENDDYVTKGRKMANALISSDQELIAYEGIR